MQEPVERPQRQVNPALGPGHLRTVYLLAAAVTLITTAVAWPLDVVWATRYGLLASLALLNWIALGLILAGLTGRNFLLLLGGVMLKPLLFLLLLAAAQRRMIEPTSFLAAMNTFFATLFGYMVWRAFRSPRGSSSE